MRSQRIILSLVLPLGGILAVQSSALSEEYRGTWAQQMACTPDVMRLCSDQIPDVNRIVACLRQNTPQLGDSCRAVFESNASEPQPAPRGSQQAAPRTRSAQPQTAQPQQPKRYYAE